MPKLKGKILILTITASLALNPGIILAEAEKGTDSPPITNSEPVFPSNSNPQNLPGDFDGNGDHSGGKNQEKSLTVDGVLDYVNKGLDGAESLLDGGLAGIPGSLGNLLGGLFGDSADDITRIFQDVAGIFNLVNRLVNIPAKLSQYQAEFFRAINNEVDPCLKTPTFSTTPFGYEPGWCLGLLKNLPPSDGEESDDSNGSDNEGSEDNGSDENGDPVAEGENPPFGPAPRKSSVGEILAESTGALGLPIPAEVKAKVQDQILNRDATTNLFQKNKVVEAHYASNSVDRMTAEQHSMPILSSFGQRQIAEGMEAALQTSISSYQIAGQAQGKRITQDVMKDMVSLQAQSNLLLSSVATSTLSNQNQQATANQNLNNISRSIDQIAQESPMRQAALARRILQVSRQTSLY